MTQPDAGAPPGHAGYTAAAAGYASARAPDVRLSVLISRLRLATFLSAVAGLIWLMAGGPFLLLPSAVALLVLFGALVAWHSRVESRLAWLDALRVVNARAAARVNREWSALPQATPPDGSVTASHPYAADLDLFGRGSLVQWLGPAATAVGYRRLAEWLLAPAPPDEIVARQQAAGELAGAARWREELAAHGVLAERAGYPDVERFLAWAEGPGVFAGHERLIHGSVLLLTAAIWVLLILFATGVLDAALWLAPVVIGLVISFAWGGRTQEWFDRAGGGQQALARYASLLDHATRAPSGSARLSSLAGRLSGGGSSAPLSMRRLNRILGFAELRRGAAILHFPIQAFTLWDFHVLLALERWRRTTGPRVRGWLDALGELDALALFGNVGYDHPSWAVPVLGGAAIDATALGHPLIDDGRRVSNDVRVGPRGTLLLVTGSNMSGKSTLLRSIGLNVVLAQAGCVVAARAFSLPPADLQTSLRVQDSLELGLSYFMAALARLKGVIDAAQHERPGRTLVYLLDEILQGTNSVERAIAVRAVARHLLDSGAIGAMTTHDLSLAGDEPIASAAELVHFTEIVGDNGGMRFDYRLRPGLATSRNALRLMKMIGIDL